MYRVNPGRYGSRGHYRTGTGSGSTKEDRAVTEFINIYNSLLSGKYGEAMKKLRDLLENRGDKSFIGGTTKSAFRKIHSVITDIIEKISTISSCSGANVVISELAKAALLIKYQAKRQTISPQLAEGLYRVIDNIITTEEKLKSDKASCNEALKSLKENGEALKILIDGIIAFGEFKNK